MSEPIINVIGQFNGFQVTTEDIERKFYVKTEVIEDGKRKEKSVPVRQSKRNIIIKKDDSKVVFSAYWHQGQKRYKDSRDKGSSLIPSPCAREMVRILKIDEHEAMSLLKAA